LAKTHAVDRGDQLDDCPERQLAAADPLRLQDAEQPGAMQILDRLVGHAAQFLGLAGALAQHRHQRLGALQQLREIRRPAAATRLRLGHCDTSFPAEPPVSGDRALYSPRRPAARC
jgi:hypothetical protein